MIHQVFFRSPGGTMNVCVEWSCDGCDGDVIDSIKVLTRSNAPGAEWVRMDDRQVTKHFTTDDERMLYR